jgi:sugar lactone lactonase YvrE
VPDLPRADGLKLAISPDGRTLYAIDTADGRLKVIPLT